MQAAARGNIAALECPHMQLIDDSASYPDEVILRDESLRQLSSEGEYKLLMPKTIENCLQRNSSSALAKSPAVMAVVSGRYITLSIFNLFRTRSSLKRFL